MQHPAIRAGVGIVAALLLAVLAALATPGVAAPLPQASGDFDGWVVQQDGAEFRFPRTERWNGSPGANGLIMRLGNEFQSFHGTFRAMDLKKASPVRVNPQQTPRAWTIIQGKDSFVFSKQEGWTYSNAGGGVNLTRKGQTVYFYGSFRVHYQEG